MAPTSSGFLVEIDGSPLAADAKALLISAHVDDSLRLPDLFVLRFRDSERIVIAKSGREDRFQGEDLGRQRRRHHARSR